MDTDCELPVFYSHSEPVAAKAHRCIECSAPIDKGERHFCCCGKWDGGVETFRQHLICCEACILIRNKFTGGDCIGFGTLKEVFDEMRNSWYPRSDRQKSAWKELRSLMAQILWRERKAKRRVVT